MKAIVAPLDAVSVQSGCRHLEVFDSFLVQAAAALAAGSREEEYLAEVKRWDRSVLPKFAEAFGALVMTMEDQPFTDLLGPIYMDRISNGQQQWTGEFHTPAPVCQLMADMLLGDIPDNDKPITLLEPACGAGAMILAAARAYHGRGIAPSRLRVTAIDVSRSAVNMTFINTTLWGIPCRVVHGNTLSNETWKVWHNLHWLAPWLTSLGASIGRPEDGARVAELSKPHQGVDMPAPTQQAITKQLRPPAQLDLF